MREIVGETVVRRLVAWGVRRVFGLPGDGINGLMEGFRRHGEEIEFVLVAHEEAAAFMATAHAKVTGELGVCVATSGPGAIHLLNGLYDAKLDRMPVLAITGTQATEVLGSEYQQEVHVDHLYQDVAGYNLMVTNPRQVPGVIDLAVRHAMARRTVAHLTFPNDLQVAPSDADPYRHVGPGGPVASAPIFPGPTVSAPDPADLDRAAEVLAAGRKIVVLAGIGARDAGPELLGIAEVLGAPIVKTLSGKAVVPDDHPLTTGGIGLLGTKPSERAMQDCDTLLMVGTSFPYSTHLPAPGQAQVVQIDRDPALIGMRLPVQVPLVGDSRKVLELLQSRLDRHDDRTFLTERQREMTAWRSDMRALEDAGRSPIAPQYVIGCLNEAADDRAILTCDSGTIATWAARHWTIRGGREFYLSGNLATMAPGLPYAIAAQFAHPGRQVIAYVGDGGFAMLMAEFLTAVRYRLPITVVINNNNGFGQILWEQLVLGYPEYAVRNAEPAADFAAWARGCGAYAQQVSEADQVRPAIDAALAHPGPALVDVQVNPNEPPLPGKLEFSQAKGFLHAMVHGQPHRAATVATIARDKVSQILHG